MARYLAIRSLYVVPQLLGIAILMFFLTYTVPGDPIVALVGEFPAPPEYVAQLREEFGLDKPLLTQFWLYLKGLAQGNLGYSFAFRASVLDIIGERIGATLLLAGSALLLGALGGVVLGLIAGRFHLTWIDASISVLSLAGFAVPVFWLGQIFILVFAISLQWFPTSGMVSLRSAPEGFARVLDIGRHLVLPSIALSFGYLSLTTRLMRASVIEALQQDYVRTAYAKGLRGLVVLIRHAVPNALLPVLTSTGYFIGFLLSGSALVESVFAWPGIGRLLYDSLFSRDYPVLMGIFMVTSLAAIAGNLLADLAYARIDPRIRYG